MNSQTRARFILVLVVLFLLGGTVWAVRGIKSATKGTLAPMAAATLELHQKLTGPDAQKMTPEERREMWGQLRNLDKDQRQHFFDLMHKSEMEKIDKVLAMSPEERNAYLDAEIARQEARRKEWEERSKNRDSKGPSEAKGPSDGKGSRSGGPGGPFGQGGPDGAPHPDREKMRKDFFDKSSPEDRAKMSEMRRLTADRQQQLKSQGGAPAKK